MEARRGQGNVMPLQEVEDVSNLIKHMIYLFVLIIFFRILIKILMQFLGLIHIIITSLFTFRVNTVKLTNNNTYHLVW